MPTVLLYVAGAELIYKRVLADFTDPAVVVAVALLVEAAKINAVAAGIGDKQSDHHPVIPIALILLIISRMMSNALRAALPAHVATAAILARLAVITALGPAAASVDTAAFVIAALIGAQLPVR